MQFRVPFSSATCDGAKRGDIPMLKATKLALAAAFIAGGCGLAMAQGSGASGAGADKTPSSTGADKIRLPAP